MPPESSETTRPLTPTGSPPGPWTRSVWRYAPCGMISTWKLASACVRSTRAPEARWTAAPRSRSSSCDEPGKRLSLRWTVMRKLSKLCPAAIASTPSRIISMSQGSTRQSEKLRSPKTRCSRSRSSGQSSCGPGVITIRCGPQSLLRMSRPLSARLILRPSCRTKSGRLRFFSVISPSRTTTTVSVSGSPAGRSCAVEFVSCVACVIVLQGSRWRPRGRTYMGRSR